MDIMQVINEIEKIRINNNKLWMDLLRIAFTHAPELSKEIFKKITENDKKINEFSRRLYDE